MEPPEHLLDDEFEAIFAECDIDKNLCLDRKEFVPFIREFGKESRYHPGYESDDPYTSEGEDEAKLQAEVDKETEQRKQYRLKNEGLWKSGDNI